MELGFKCKHTTWKEAELFPMPYPRPVTGGMIPRRRRPAIASLPPETRHALCAVWIVGEA